MMKKSDELAWKGFQLLLGRRDYSQFFDVLREAGFFAPAKNPAPVSGERENTVRIPFWAPLTYLKTVATHAGTQNDMTLAAKLMSVVRATADWRDDKGEPQRNYQTDRIFAEIFGLLPTNAVALSDIDLLGEWLSDPYDRMLVASALDQGPLPRFLASADPADWNKATRVLFHVTAISWRNSGDEREPTPVGVVDDFWLGELLRHHAKQIGGKAGDGAAKVMIGRVREIFSTPLRRDHSSLFRPAVEDHAQNYEWRSIENRAVEGLRDVLLGWSDENPKNACAEIEYMLKDNLQIIRRVGVYVLAQRWTSMHDLFGGTTVTTLLDAGHSHELHCLLQDHFAEMTPEQQSEVLGAIEAIPEPTYGDDPARMRRQIRYRWLSAIRGRGHSDADRRFADLDADPAIGKLGDHPDLDSYITSRVGPGPAPYSPEELTILARTKMLTEKLNTFKPGDEWRGPTISGLASALEAAARTSPDLFLHSLPQHLSTKPVYQHAVLSGIKQAWEGKADADWTRGWELVISFFERLVNKEDFWDPKGDEHQHWVVSMIADFLRAGTKDDSHAYDAGLLPRTQLVVACLLEHEAAASSAAEDAMMQALNTSKGRIIEALYSQALRAARVNDRQRGSHKKTWEAIRPLFEAELAKCTNANFEFSTLTGTYLPQLQYLDDAWTTERLDQIFPATYQVNTVCALDGLSYASFTRPVYELLAKHGIVDRALHLELRGRASRGKLLERIGAAYLWRLEPLDGAIFSRLFDTATTKDLEIMIRVFWMVRNENLEPDQKVRILTFWGRTLEWARRQTPAPAGVLSTLSLLAGHITTLGTEEQRLLEAVAPHVHVGHEGYEFTGELLRLAPQDPSAIAKILQSMIAAHVPDYDYQDRLQSLLRFLAEHGQREAVIVLSDPLRQLSGIETLFKSLTQR